MSNDNQTSNGNETDNNHDISKYYAVNHDSTAIFVTTVKDENEISSDVKEVFEAASVLFLSISMAISKAGKNLFDYNAYNILLGQSGSFAPRELEEKTFQYTANTVSLDLSIVEGVIGTAVAPEAEMALKSVIHSIGSTLQLTDQKTKSISKVAKAMLWVEEIMGIPDVSIQLWYVERDDITHVTKTTCSETASQDINFKYYSQEFAFIDPTWIKKFSGDFKSSPQFEALVTRFVGILKNSKPDQPKS